MSIRGFRVELGEIESHLQSHPLIEQAVVIAQAGRLIAYIQGTGESKQWRSWLANKLPDYMVPSVFQTIEHFPLTANGKIDRKVLPAPEETPEESYTAAETEIEATLIAIWESLLGKSPIGIHDNFFHLGGDSILSIQVVSRAREKGMILKPKQLFAHQTIATLASVAETEAQVVGEQGTLVGDVPLLPIQQWFLEETKHPHHFNQSMMVTTGEVNETKLQETIEALVLHHDALRMRFVPTDKGWKQIYQAENNIELEIIDLQAASNPIAELEQRAEEAQASLHLTDGPLFRAIWFRLSQEEGRLLLVAHHLIMDGVSWRIVLEDVETIYQQLVAGKSIFLPAKTSSYRQWAKHLQEWAISTEIEEQRTYWEQVSNTNLPQDKWGMNTEKSVEQMQVLLSPEETEKLVSETTGRTHATIEEILLTAFMQALQKWTGQKKHTIHLEGHGRQEQEGIDLSRTVGWFTSLYPVTFELTSSVIGEALQVVKDTLREANKKGIGYGMLRHLHPTPLEEVDATISFNYLGKFNPVQQKDQQGLIRGTAQESAGHTIALEAVRPHLLDVIAVIYQGQLQITWLYSQNMHNKTTMESFKQYFQSHLYTLITGKEKNMGMTASDFPEADLSKKDMKKVLQFLQKKSKGR
ncbi:condensation domain-containing protein [Shimazuella kribbensis]|uniref:condensation domain-containing protein n=1 Tax=Shimazuella kribbensis TaxID=139808 RepID=UPI003CCBF92E